MEVFEQRRNERQGTMASSLPSLAQIRQIFRLLGECTELGADPIAWRNHLTSRFADVIGEGFVNLVESPHPSQPKQLPQAIPLGYFSGGELPNADWNLIKRFLNQAEQVSPILPKMFEQYPHLETKLRKELVSDSAFFRSEYFQEYLRPLGLHDQVISLEGGAREAISTLCFLSRDQERFTVRQRRMIDFLHQELTHLKQAGQLAPLGGFSLWDLSPRQRDVLRGIFRGDSESQIARRLGLSQHTVHDYVKALHRRLGVCSRGELMSRCLKFWPALEQFEDLDSLHSLLGD